MCVCVCPCVCVPVRHHQQSLTRMGVSLAVFSGTVTQYSGCSQCGGWLWMLVMKTVSSTELLRPPPSDAMICRTILDVCGGDERMKDSLRKRTGRSPQNLATGL